MPKTISWGFEDSPISGVTELSFDRALLNFKADFREKAKSATEAVITNITSPFDRPERIRFAVSDISNVYAGTDIDPSVYSPSRRGVSVLAQVTSIASVTDSNDADFRVDLPISAHIVLKVPSSEHLDAGKIQTIVARLVSSLFETGDESTSRLDALIRGSLLPKDM